jgi:septal ring factor EnvC (AmiA/AmiB activator)
LDKDRWRAVDIDPPSEPWIGRAPPDPVLLGLERKLDVLRAQLAACRAGQDPGEAGVATWSRLEVQSQRIAELEAQLTELREQLSVTQRLRPIIDALAADAAGSPPSEIHTGDRMLAATQAERVWQELVATHRTLRKLGQSLVETAAREACKAAVVSDLESRLTEARHDLEQERERHGQTAAQAAVRLAQAMAAIDAMTSSTCWRLTWPIRALGGVWNRLR